MGSDRDPVTQTQIQGLVPLLSGCLQRVQDAETRSAIERAVRELITLSARLASAGASAGASASAGSGSDAASVALGRLLGVDGGGPGLRAVAEMLVGFALRVDELTRNAWMPMAKYTPDELRRWSPSASAANEVARQAAQSGSGADARALQEHLDQVQVLFYGMLRGSLVGATRWIEQASGDASPSGVRAAVASAGAPMKAARLWEEFESRAERLESMNPEAARLEVERACVVYTLELLRQSSEAEGTS